MMIYTPIMILESLTYKQSDWIAIFNDRGEKIFEIDDTTNIGWGGNYKGEELNAWMFNYHTEIESIFGLKIIKAVSATIIG